MDAGDGCRRRAAGGGEAAEIPKASDRRDEIRKILLDESERMRLWETAHTKIESERHHCVLLICAHGLTKDTGMMVTRSCAPEYMADVNVYSIVGGSLEPGTEYIIKDTDITNYFVMPTAAWSVFNKEKQQLKTIAPRENQISKIKLLVDEFGHKIEGFNAAAGIEYETPPVWEDNPSLTREFYMLPNRNEIDRRPDAAETGIRSLPQRTCADLGFLKEHGILLIFTTKPDHKELSLAEISPANLTSHNVGEFVGEPFITPKIIKHNNIFDYRNHKKFQDILVLNGVDETDLEGAIQILRRGVKNKIITLQELSILIYCLGYTSFTLLDGSCRTLREHVPQEHEEFIHSLGTEGSQNPERESIPDIDPTEEPDEEPDEEPGGTSIRDRFTSLIGSLNVARVILKTTTDNLISRAWWKKQIQSWRSKPKQGGSINSSRKSSRMRTHTRKRTRTRKHKKGYTKRRYID